MNNEISTTAIFLQEIDTIEKELAAQLVKNQNNKTYNLLMSNGKTIDNKLKSIFEKFRFTIKIEDYPKLKNMLSLIQENINKRDEKLLTAINKLLKENNNNLETIKDKVIHFFSKPHDNWNLTTKNTAEQAVEKAKLKFIEKYGKDIASHVEIKLWYKPHLNRNLEHYSDSWHLSVKIDGEEISNSDRKKAIKLFLENTDY